MAREGIHRLPTESRLLPPQVCSCSSPHQETPPPGNPPTRYMKNSAETLTQGGAQAGLPIITVLISKPQILPLVLPLP